MLVIVPTPQTRPPEAGSSRLYFSGSAGANRGRVELEISNLPEGWEYNEVLPGTLGVQTAGKTCLAQYVSVPSDSRVAVVVHCAQAGTWHGAGVLSNSAEYLPGEGHTRIEPHPGEQWFARSGSGGGEIAAGIWVLGSTALEIRTSGYDGRRWWTIVTVTHENLAVTEESVAEWRARHATAVPL